MAPAAAPIAAPSSGMKKIRPNRSPQNVPPSAPAAVVLLPCRVLGLVLPGSHETVAVSWTWISSCFWSWISASWACSAPSTLSNFHTVRVATSVLFRVEGAPLRRGAIER
jgi:hypothetical protein